MGIHRSIGWALGVGSCLVVGCADDAAVGEGSLAVHVSGEEAAQSGFPVGSGEDEIAFADGWSLEFHKVLVSVTDLQLETASGDAAELEAGPVVADVHHGDGLLWEFPAVPARRWDKVGYRYAPPAANARRAGEVDEADLEHMRTQGYSFYIEATAHKADKQVEIAWGFPFTVQHTDCKNADGTDGVVVRDNTQNTAQITVHLDHLFFDSYVSEEPELRFDAMAAVAPEQGPLTLDDLAGQNNLSDLKAEGGVSLDLAYDSGSDFKPVPRDLKQYVIAAATTTGHWNGEGHCEYSRQ